MKLSYLKLADFAENGACSIIGGPFGSKLTTKDYTNEGVPILRGSNLSEVKYIDEDDHIFVSEEKVSRDLSSNIACPGDLIFTQRGTLGQVAIIPENSAFPTYVISQSQMRMTVDSSKADVDFLYYYFSSNEVVGKIKNLVSSSGVPHINLSILRNFDVPDLPLDSQKDIGVTLSRYDDLIANNRKRIGLLEESARLLFREWFVHLRFPGHERVKVRDGVPEGWEKAVLGDFCEAVRQTVSPEEVSQETPYIGLEHIPRRSITLSSWETAEKVTSTKHRFQEGDILFGKIRPYFHKVGFALVDGIASSDAIVIRPLSESVYPLVLMTMSSDEFVAMSSQTSREGSKMPRADWEIMVEWPMLRPPQSLLVEFNGHARPVLQQLKTLAFETHRLQSARDMLLPRLMSGEVAV